MIKIEAAGGYWYLTLSAEGQAVKYTSLYKLAKALMKYAKGQGL